MNFGLILFVFIVLAGTAYAGYRLFTEKLEGFETAVGAYRNSSGYKKQIKLIADLADNRSNGRRDIVDMLACAKVPD